MEKLKGRKNKKTEDKNSERKLVEEAASRLAELFLEQIIQSKNKNYERKYTQKRGNN